MSADAGPIPSRADLNLYDSLDERVACGHFLGKNLDEAEALFRENPLRYQEDLMWMGPVGFQYYVQAAIRYVRSPSAKGDSDIVNGLAGLLAWRLESDPSSVAPVADLLADTCQYVVDHWAEFEVEPEIYGELHTRWTGPQKTLSRRR